MKQAKRYLFPLFIFLILTLFSLPVLAQGSSQYKRNMCADKVTEVCVLNAYNSYWQQHHNLDQWHRQKMACESDYLRRAQWWEDYYDKYPLARFLQGPDASSQADAMGCLNALERMRLHEYNLKVAEPDARFRAMRLAEAEEREAKRRRDEITRLRPIDPNRLPKPSTAPEPQKQRLTPGEAAVLLAQANAAAAATNAVLTGEPAAQKPRRTASRPAGSAKPRTVRTRRDVVQNRYDQFMARNPKVEDVPASGAPVEAKHRINCIPEHVSVCKVEADGSLELFNDAGADWLQYARCFPDHDTDAKRVAEANPFKATIAYAYDSAKPLNRQKLTFSERRWKLKKEEWDLSGKEAYKDFFNEHKDEAIGIALQGKQILKLAVKSSGEKRDAADSGSTKNTSAPASGEGASLERLESVPWYYAQVGSNAGSAVNQEDEQLVRLMSTDARAAKRYRPADRALDRVGSDSRADAGRKAGAAADMQAWRERQRMSIRNADCEIRSENLFLHSEHRTFLSERVGAYAFT
ncbi:MAG: hypothetical protein ACOYUZ_03745 [Patescibacteria group bacterium]